MEKYCIIGIVVIAIVIIIGLVMYFLSRSSENYAGIDETCKTYADNACAKLKSDKTQHEKCIKQATQDCHATKQA